MNRDYQFEILFIRSAVKPPQMMNLGAERKTCVRCKMESSFLLNPGQKEKQLKHAEIILKS